MGMRTVNCLQRSVAIKNIYRKLSKFSFSKFSGKLFRVENEKEVRQSSDGERKCDTNFPPSDMFYCQMSFPPLPIKIK